VFRSGLTLVDKMPQAHKVALVAGLHRQRPSSLDATDDALVHPSENAIDYTDTTTGHVAQR
jgi:hypothetical protein